MTEKVGCCVCRSSESEVISQGKDYEYKTSDDMFSFVRCLHCDHLYLNPRPEKSMMTVIYPENYYSFSLTKKKPVIAMPAKRMVDYSLVRLVKGIYGLDGRILDVGCGDGRLLEIFKAEKGNRWELYGVDIDEKAKEMAEEKGVTVFLGSIEDISLPENYFDVVIMQQLIEHTFDPEKALEESFKSLKKGGLIVLETPTAPSLDFRLFKKRYWGGYHYPRHFNIFNKDSIKMLLERCGFTEIVVNSKLSPAFWIHSLHNMLFDKEFPDWVVSFFSWKNPVLLAIFSLIDLFAILLGRNTSNMRIVARKP
jgi:SAM-dependent methyltransferase